MFEVRLNGVGVCENKPKHSVRIAVVEYLVEFFPHIIASQSIVGEAYVVKGRFVFRGGGDSVWGQGFVEEGSDVFVYYV